MFPFIYKKENKLKIVPDWLKNEKTRESTLKKQAKREEQQM